MKIIYELCPYEDREELESIQKAQINAILREDLQQFVVYLVNDVESDEIKVQEVIDKLNKLLDD